ncbi:kinase-like domain-containing protein [Aspergillus pseudodeflectus]|uniref:Kinase-like domain-containing protein n=1 Tax=Aspergillus pseudodeflectus TaxID=176178 RepID=A0ABR4JZ96_9EURO
MFSSALKSLSSNISANYQVSPHPTIVSGPWKIHDGKKKSTNTAASIFIFDKKALEPRSGGLGGRSSSSIKKLQEEVVERLKREAGNLARLRHPSVLQVLEPVEETRNGGLMFATERITASLAGLLQEKDSQESNGRIGSRTSRYMVEESDGSRRRRDLDIDELEIQKGLLQVAKGLEFLHESAGLVHGNLNPEAIFINAKSDWKISGLGFAGPSDSAESKSSLPPLALSEVLYQDPRLPSSVQLNLDYTSPDFAMDSNVNASADLFSLGLIIIALYNSPHDSPLKPHGSVDTYKRLLSSPSSTPSQGNNFLCSGTIPKDLLAHVLPRLITRRAAQRLSAREFQQSQYFDNILVSTIRFLESLPAKNANEKSQFMRGLQRVLPEFPVTVLERKLLGALLDELKDRELLPLILQNVFAILKKIPNARRVFPEKVIPQLKDVFPVGKGAERDSKKDAGLMVVLENMNVVAENCSGKEFKDDILPFIRLGLDSPTHTLVDAAIKCLPSILPVLDFSTVKNDVFPPIASTFSRTNSLAIKIRCLEAFTVLCGGSVEQEDAVGDDMTGIVEKSKPQPPKSSILDKYTIQEKLVPSLKAIKTKEPAVMMAALGVFRQIGKVADTDFLALEILPVLWSFSLGPLLDLRQFGEFMALIKNISSKIEREQMKKLQELSSAESTGFHNGTSAASKGSSSFASSEIESGRDNFERLVLGRGGAALNGQENDIFGGLATDAPSSQSPTPRPSSTTFSWSSNTGVVGRQPSLAARSITPDFKVNSFPSLQPAPKQTSPASTFPALQPSAPNPWSTPTTPSHLQQSMTSGSGPSLSSLASMNPTVSSSKSTQAAPNYSAFSIPPPPATQPLNAFANTSQTLSPPNTGQASSFLANGAGQSQQATQKQGLDKYQSLI